jgi:hypothetical protein
MSKQLIWGCSTAIVVVIGLWQFQVRRNEPAAVFNPPLRQNDAAPLCPWREPETDLKILFPRATHHTTETRILSGHRVELAKHLGRLPEPDENALLRHRVFAGSENIGFVLTRRVKGEHGAIELVVALNPRGEVEGILLQRLREPYSIASQLRNQSWLSSFGGRTYGSGWESDDLVGLSEEARASAIAIREGVRSLLILQTAAEGDLK